MIVVLDSKCTLKEKAAVVRFVEQRGGRILVTVVGEETHIGLIDAEARALADTISDMPGVSELLPVAPPYPHVSREYQPESTEVRVGDVVIGGSEVVIMAGPCSVESADQLRAIAGSVVSSGARILRGGSVQTSKLALQLSRLGRAGPCPARRDEGRHRLAGGDGGGGTRRRRFGWRICRHAPDRGEEHAELPSSVRSRRAGETRAAQAGNCLNDRGVAAGC